VSELSKFNSPIPEQELGAEPRDWRLEIGDTSYERGSGCNNVRRERAADGVGTNAGSCRVTRVSL